MPDDVARIVFLRRNIDEPFSYKVPSDFDAPGELIGQPVVVPLGSDLTVGVIVDVQTGTESDEDLKPFDTLIDSVQALPRELVELGNWVSEYYLGSAHGAFRSILPPRYLPKPRRLWKATGNSVDSADESKFKQLPPTGETFSKSDLKDDLSSTSGGLDESIDELVKDGILEPTVELEAPKVNPRRLNYVKLTEDSSAVKDRLDELSTRQRELVELLLEVEGEYQKDLPEPLARTSLIDRLEDEEIISREKRIYRRVPLPSVEGDGDREDLTLTEEQEHVLEQVNETVREDRFDVHLVHGVTGSGKTEVYFRLIERVLDRGETALVLVPEITLASFMVTEFRTRFGDRLALLHSGLSKGERYDEWRRIQDGEAEVVLGVQSAVFAPLENLGLVVVDEEHDTSYKSGQSPRYHARDVAVVRGRKAEIPVVLGSATPSLESYVNSLRNRYKKHEMKERPLGGELPSVRVIDLKNKSSLLTDPLVETTRAVLEKGHRAIWFYNRRGMSNFILCEDCGDVVKCRQCNVSLTVHDEPRRLRCHYCGFSTPVPETCSNCRSESLDSVGLGTQTLANRARQLFDDATIVRMDQDTVTKKDSRFEKLNAFGEKSPCLLVGTQMVTKGLDYENVDFVGVVLADTGLQFPDFRSGERTFQQLVQVCGRAGRKEAGAEVFVQTYNPGHYAILNGKKGDFEAFASKELQNRKPLKYPPFARLINIIAKGREERDVSRVLNRLRDDVPSAESVQWLGPSPCGIDYVKGNYRWHLMARGHFDREWKAELRKVIDQFSSQVRLVVDVDPLEVL